jgi:hypothetical protein
MRKPKDSKLYQNQGFDKVLNLQFGVQMIFLVAVMIVVLAAEVYPVYRCFKAKNHIGMGCFAVQMVLLAYLCLVLPNTN